MVTKVSPNMIAADVATQAEVDGAIAAEQAARDSAIDDAVGHSASKASPSGVSQPVRRLTP